jgi:hypothetical protein
MRRTLSASELAISPSRASSADERMARLLVARYPDDTLDRALEGCVPLSPRPTSLDAFRQLLDRQDLAS